MSIFGTPTSGGKAGAGVTSLVTPNFNTNAGDLVVACGINFGDTQAMSCADVVGNSFTADTLYTGSNLSLKTQWFYKLSSSGANANNNATISVAGAATNLVVFAWSIPISGGSAAFDVSSYIDYVSHASPVPSASYNTTGTDEFVLCLLYDPNAASTWSAGTGYTSDGATSGLSNRARGEHGQFSDGPTAGKTSTWAYTGGPFGEAMTTFAAKASGGASAQPVIVVWMG